MINSPHALPTFSPRLYGILRQNGSVVPLEKKEIPRR